MTTDRRSIFITGAASGIGRATAELFARSGWKVGLCDRQSEHLVALARELGQGASVHRADVTDAAVIRQALFDFCGGKDQPLDAIFCSAGILDMQMFGEAPIRRLHDVIDVNVKGIINCLHAALPYLRLADDARAVSMCSGSAIYGTPEIAVYSASKFAVRGLTEALNVEWEADGIWVSDLLVSYVDTPMVSEADVVAKSVEIVGVNVKPSDVALTVFEAVTGERRLHWFVTEGDREYARLIDATPWEERAEVVRGVAGF